MADHADAAFNQRLQRSFGVEISDEQVGKRDEARRRREDVRLLASQPRELGRLQVALALCVLVACKCQCSDVSVGRDGGLGGGAAGGTAGAGFDAGDGTTNNPTGPGNGGQGFVLDGGRLVETGTHEELMRRRGMYFRAAALQAADQESRSLLAAWGAKA